MFEQMFFALFFVSEKKVIKELIATGSTSEAIHLFCVAVITVSYVRGIFPNSNR